MECSLHQLSMLEQQWLALFEGSENPALRLAVVLFAWHEFVFIGRYIPYVVMDRIPFFRQYKIQQDKDVSREQWIKCVMHVLASQLFFELPMMMAFHPVAVALGMKVFDVPFPSLSKIAVTTLFCLFMEDFYQYFVHRLLHWGSLYKNIHKMHHEFAAPFGLASQYAHPLETLILGLGFFIGPLMWVLATGDLHVITVCAWLAVRLIQVVDSHSGYDFPWALRHLLPFWAGADFHDYHHMAFVGNYSSSFRWWDWIMGTDKAYNQWKLKQTPSAASEAESKKSQ